MVVNSNSRHAWAGLHDARIERGWSQQELADRIGTTKITISRWENGTTSPSLYFRQKLSEIFGKTPAELGLVHPPPSPVSRPWTIPLARTPFFTGREPLLALLHERLSVAKMAALTHPQALYGLGGIGKTRTAAEYAFRHGDDYTHVFWMRAASRETLLADFVALARRLNLPEKEEACPLVGDRDHFWGQNSGFTYGFFVSSSRFMVWRRPI
jgi:transcriptional regulator with XRE-family HTH domain